MRTGEAISALVHDMDRMGLFRRKPSCISDQYGGVELLTQAKVANDELEPHGFSRERVSGSDGFLPVRDLGMALKQLAETVEQLLHVGVQLLLIIENNQHTNELTPFREVRYYHDAGNKSSMRNSSG